MQFLPEDDLNFKTIEIYSNLKDTKETAKGSKGNKSSNTNVCKMHQKKLFLRTSRIISDNKLIAL